MTELAVKLPTPLRGATLADPSAPLRAGPPPPPPPDPRVEQERAQLGELMRTLGEAARDLAARQKQRLAEMQRVAVELAVAVAERVVRERVEAGDFAVESLVREAVERLAPETAVTVFLHPDDLALLERRLAKGGVSAPRGAEVRFEADALLERGGCRAEGGDAVVLADLREQLDGMRGDLLEALPTATVERRKGEVPLRRFPDRRQTA